MKRIAALAVLAVAVAVAAGVALGARNHHGHGPNRHPVPVAAPVALGARDHHGHGKRNGKVIHVIEHATSDAVTNTGNGGGADNAGDILTFANPVFDAKNSKQVGTDQGYCVRVVVGQSWECNWTTFLPGGQVTVEGPFYDTKNSVLAITGGTGAYSHARGWMQLNSLAGGTQFDFIFHLTP
jgi:allene oxide cyclase